MHELEERRKVELQLRAANEDLRAYFAEHTSRLTEPLSGAAADLEAILQEMEAEERDSDAVREKLRDAIGTIRTTEKRLTELIEVARKEQQDVGQEQGYFMPQTIQGSYRP